MDGQHRPLIVPALRAHMGTWIYYSGFMKMRDIAERIRIAEEIHSSESLRDLLQRQLSSRAGKIAEYLRTQDQRFFSTIVVGTYGGDPQWLELAVRTDKSTDRDQIDQLEGILGFLRLEGSETLFAIDGQHRVAGIRAAIRQDGHLENDEVSVIFVAGVTQQRRHQDPIGFERTRRLFTTLNRYAKPVSKKDIIALDEDDAVAIIIRRMVEDYPLFKKRISVKKSKNLPASDTRSLTTIETLYDALDRYLKVSRGWQDFKRFRPSDIIINELYSRCVELWDVLISSFAVLQELSRADENSTVESYRNSAGGHLLFRPIGLLIIIDVIRQLQNDGVALDAAVQALAMVPMQLNQQPWTDLLWDSVNQRMITATPNQRAATRILYYAVGGNLRNMKTSEQKLREELVGILKRESVNLVRYTNVRSTASLFTLDPDSFSKP